MDLIHVISGELRLTSLSNRTKSKSHCRRCSPPLLPDGINVDDGQKKKKKHQQLSHILRRESAVLGIERKAKGISAKSDRLWPKAVLEALDHAISSNHWQSALEIFALLQKQQWYNPKGQTYAKMLTMLGKCGQPESAASLFRVMLTEGLKPTVDVYTSLVGAYGGCKMLDEAFHIVDEMKTILDCKPDVYTYSILINCCCKHRCFDKIPTLLSEMSYLGIECSSVTYNTIIDGYGKAGMFREMEESLLDMLEGGKCLPDIVTMNSIISAYGKGGEFDKMEKWYDKFQHMGVEPDVRTFNILIRSYGLAGLLDKMAAVMFFMEKWFFSPSTVTYNIIIDCLGRIGNIEKMESFFRQMKYRGVKPNTVTYCSVISAYSKAGLLWRVPSIIRQIENSDVVLDTVFFNSVISAYGHAGDIHMMEEMFSLMEERKCKPDEITFATMIHSYDALGMVETAQELRMKLHKMNSKLLVSTCRKRNQTFQQF